jgi:Ser/Thr protein kinase RdoA (MazF antagonist)
VLSCALCCTATAQVSTEHAILAQLAQQELSFKVPTALPALKTGEPYVVLSNGAAACVFEIIPGEPDGCSKHTASTALSAQQAFVLQATITGIYTSLARCLP